MTSELFETITSHGAAVNLSSRAKFRLSGADRARYLNGQVTQDVRNVAPGAALYACVTDAKGRIAGDLFIHAVQDTLLLDAESGLREALSLRLERYIVADDVELADVTDEWQLWHVWGGCGEGVRAWRFGVEGRDIWLPTGAPAPTFGTLPILNEADLETWRILQKVPRWPNELSTETFPPEAGLMERAMSFSKGCYIGQEVLSRIKATGKMPRELIAFECDAAVAAGDEICGEKPVGRVTSVARHPLSGRCAGLGMIKHGAASAALTIAGHTLHRC